ncbi:DnaA-like protein, partial [Fonticella tunisiensis]
YLGLRKDAFNIVDEDFIMQLFSQDGDKARKLYLELVYACNNQAMIDTVEFKNEKSQYRSERVILIRDFPPEEILEFVSKCTGIDKRLLRAKNRREATEGRALCVFLMRYLCNFTHSDICKVLGYTSASRISKLGTMGLRLAYNDERYMGVIDRLIKERSA